MIACRLSFGVESNELCKKRLHSLVIGPDPPDNGRLLLILERLSVQQFAERCIFKLPLLSWPLFRVSHIVVGDVFQFRDAFDD